VVDERELPLDAERRPGRGVELDVHTTSEAQRA
jgi:hypothetical protein